MAKKSAKKKAPANKAPVKQPATGKGPSKKPRSKPVRTLSPGTSGITEPGALTSARVLRFLDTATYLALHALVIAVPLAFGQFTFDQFDMPKVVTLRLITLVAMATWSARFLLGRKTEIRRTPLDWFILVFLGWVTLSTIFSVHLPTALLGKYRRYEGFISLVNYAVVFFIAVQVLRSYRRLRALAKTMIITGAVVGLYGVAQAFGYDFLQWGALPFDRFRAFSTYGNPDLLVGYLAVLVPIGIGLVITTEDRFEAAGYGLCTGIILTSLVTTFSRSAWIGLAGAFVFLAVVLWRQRMLARPQVIAVAACFVLIVGGLTVYSLRSPNPVTSVYARALSLLSPSEGSAGTRLEIWKSAAAATKDRPVFGFGPDTFRLIFPRYKTVRYVQMAGYRSVADNAHSYPFQLAPAIGIPGVILFYALVVVATVKAIGLTWKRGGHEEERVLIGSFAAAALAYSGHLLFGLSVTGTTIFLWIVLAAAMLPFVKTSEISWRPSSAAIRASSLGVIGLLVVAGLYLNYRFFIADVWNLRSYQFQQVNREEAIAASSEALALNPYWDAYRAQKALLLLDRASADNDRQEFLSAIAMVRGCITASPREYDNYLFLASAYSTSWKLLGGRQYLAGSPDSRYATQQFDVDNPDANIPANTLDVSLYALRNVEPNAPSAMAQAGMAYLQTGAPAKARLILERAVYEDPKYEDAFYLLGNTYEALGDRTKALVAYKEAVRLRQNAPAGQTTSFPEAAQAIKRLEAVVR